MKILYLVDNPEFMSGPSKWAADLVNEVATSEKDVEIIDKVNLKSIKNADVIHICAFSLDAAITILLAKILGKKTFVTIHGDYYREFWDKSLIIKTLWLPSNTFFSLFTDCIIFPSEYLRDKLSKIEPWIRNKSTVIGHGVPIDELKKVVPLSRKDLNVPDDAFLVVEVTNFKFKEKAKGVDTLIKHFKDFLEKYPNAMLLIIGGGKLINNYRDKYTNKNIRFTGYSPNAVAYIASCDLFAHYSYLENLPIVLLEALALGKRIVALPTGGIPEILPTYCLTKGPINIDNNNIPYYDDENLAALFGIKNVAKKYIQLYKSKVK